MVDWIIPSSTEREFRSSIIDTSLLYFIFFPLFLSFHKHTPSPDDSAVCLIIGKKTKRRSRKKKKRKTWKYLRDFCVESTYTHPNLSRLPFFLSFFFFSFPWETAKGWTNLSFQWLNWWSQTFFFNQNSAGHFLRTSSYPKKKCLNEWTKMKEKKKEKKRTPHFLANKLDVEECLGTRPR